MSAPNYPDPRKKPTNSLVSNAIAFSLSNEQRCPVCTHWLWRTRKKITSSVLLSSGCSSRRKDGASLYQNKKVSGSGESSRSLASWMKGTKEKSETDRFIYRSKEGRMNAAIM